VRPLAAHDGAPIDAASGVVFAIADLAVKALFGVVHHGLAAALLSPWLIVAGATLIFGAAVLDVFQRDLHLGFFDVVFATPFAVLATCLLALVGDSFFTAVHARFGWRPSSAAVATALLVAGSVDVAWVAATHLARSVDLDASLALAGGILVLASACACGAFHTAR
jgi:hypothetical protein